MNYDDNVDTPILHSSKETQERYRRPSVNWGSIAVNPADLVEVYRELSTVRQEHVTNSMGTRRSRTTALAHGREAVAGLLANGYQKGEIAVILSCLANE